MSKVKIEMIPTLGLNELREIHDHQAFSLLMGSRSYSEAQKANAKDELNLIAREFNSRKSYFTRAIQLKF